MSEEERIHDLWNSVKGTGYGTGLEYEFVILKTQILTSLNVVKMMLGTVLAAVTLIIGYLTYIATERPVHSMLVSHDPVVTASSDAGVPINP